MDFGSLRCELANKNPSPESLLRKNMPKNTAHPAWIGPQPKDPAPILYFSGYTCVTEAEIPVMSRTQMKFRCFSYAFLGPKAPFPRTNTRLAYKWCQKKGVRLMLDSGAFSFHTTKMLGKVGSIDEYAREYGRWVVAQLEAGVKLDFYVTFDYVKHCPEVWRVTKMLQKEFKLDPTAVYHGDQSLDWFRRYVGEGHKFICVGRVKALGSKGLRSYYERIFEEADKLGGVKLHGLMVTGQNIYRFPWYSVDSATWTRLAANGRLVTIDPARKKIGHFRVSRVQIPIPHRELIRANGFSVKKVASDPAERAVYNIQEFMKVETDHDHLKQLPQWQPVI